MAGAGLMQFTVIDQKTPLGLKIFTWGLVFLAITVLVFLLLTFLY
jgi:hypothetical protein